MKDRDKTYTIVLHWEGKWCAAYVKEVPEIHTQGASELEALGNVVSAMKDLDAINSGKLRFEQVSHPSKS